MQQALIRFGQFLLRVLGDLWGFVKGVASAIVNNFNTSWIFILSAIAVVAALYALRPRGGGSA
ncbi:MAG: hypothetical protein ABFS34_06015 [Gemmatimonadota bacterium]